MFRDARKTLRFVKAGNRGLKIDGWKNFTGFRDLNLLQ